MSGIKIIKRVKSSNIPYKGKARYDSSLPANKRTTPNRERKEPSRVVVVCNIKATNMQA